MGEREKERENEERGERRVLWSGRSGRMHGRRRDQERVARLKRDREMSGGSTYRERTGVVTTVLQVCDTSGHNSCLNFASSLTFHTYTRG